MANEAPAVWPKGTSDSDKARRSELLHAAIERNAHTLDPLARACEDLGIKRNAASMILRSERIKRDGLPVPLGAVAELTAEADGTTSSRIVHEAGTPEAEAFSAEFGDPEHPVGLVSRVDVTSAPHTTGHLSIANVEPVPGLVLTGGPLGLVVGDPRPDELVLAYRSARDLTRRLAVSDPLWDTANEVREALAYRIADRAADAA